MKILGLEVVDEQRYPLLTDPARQSSAGTEAQTAGGRRQAYRCGDLPALFVLVEQSRRRPRHFHHLCGCSEHVVE
jgi:hypothetical protein